MNKFFAFLASIFHSLKEDTKGAVDLGVVLMIGIAFAGLTVVAYIIWTIFDMLNPSTSAPASSAAWDALNTSKNITNAFDDAVSLILVAITIFILAIAIAALLMLRGR